MKVKDGGIYRGRTLSPRERVELDNLRADLAAERIRNSECEAALVELADIVTAFEEKENDNG